MILQSSCIHVQIIGLHSGYEQFEHKRYVRWEHKDECFNNLDGVSGLIPINGKSFNECTDPKKKYLIYFLQPNCGNNYYMNPDTFMEYARKHDFVPIVMSYDFIQPIESVIDLNNYKIFFIDFKHYDTNRPKKYKSLFFKDLDLNNVLKEETNDDYIVYHNGIVGTIKTLEKKPPIETKNFKRGQSTYIITFPD